MIEDNEQNEYTGNSIKSVLALMIYKIFFILFTFVALTYAFTFVSTPPGSVQRENIVFGQDIHMTTYNQLLPIYHQSSDQTYHAKLPTHQELFYLNCLFLQQKFLSFSFKNKKKI